MILLVGRGRGRGGSGWGFFFRRCLCSRVGRRRGRGQLFWRGLLGLWRFFCWLGCLARGLIGEKNSNRLSYRIGGSRRHFLKNLFCFVLYIIFLEIDLSLCSRKTYIILKMYNTYFHHDLLLFLKMQNYNYNCNYNYNYYKGIFYFTS